jgi:hypothetical protein
VVAYVAAMVLYRANGLVADTAMATPV